MAPFTLRSIVEQKMGVWKYSPVYTQDLDGMSNCSSPEKFMEIGEDQPQKRWSSSVARVLLLIKLPILLAACALASSILTIKLMADTNSTSQDPLMRTPVPEFPKEIRFFEFDWTYIDPPTPENDKAWDELLPSGRGYVFVEAGTHYGLEPGIETKDGREIYSLSMYHQLHCLGLVRRNYWRLMNSIFDNDSDPLLEARHQRKNSHTGHCFDYIRQSIECSADTTLEWPRTEPDGRRYQVDGKGIPHVCTSQGALREYLESFHFNASHNTDIAA